MTEPGHAPRPQRYAPATLVLLAAGVSPAEVARRVGMTRQAVSLHLGGHSDHVPQIIFDTIAALGGAELAAAVATAITDRKGLIE